VSYKQVTSCRICQNRELKRYLDLGQIPLVNSYVHRKNKESAEEKYPLQLDYCTNCSQSQLSIVVDPKILYQVYFYRSSISKTFIQHCHQTARSLVDRFQLTSDDLIVEIASNDGCSLQEFKKFGMRVVGVDPAQNLAKIANKQGITTLPSFWNQESALKILTEHGKASVINAANVFAHVDELDEFLQAVHILLKENGIFIIEVPYLFNFINRTEFDTTYHEHLSYFLVKPLIKLFDKHSLKVFDIEEISIHGGSIRVYVRKSTNKTIEVNEASINQLLDLEKSVGLHELTTYLTFPKDVEKIKNDLLGLLIKLRSENKKVAAYGASAKGTVLSNYCGIDHNLVSYIIDDTPEKIGYLTPGNHIEIVPLTHLQNDTPDYLILFAWNFLEELIEKTKEYRKNGGRYIIPIPSVRVI